MVIGSRERRSKKAPNTPMLKISSQLILTKQKSEIIMRRRGYVICRNLLQQHGSSSAVINNVDLAVLPTIAILRYHQPSGSQNNGTNRTFAAKSTPDATTEDERDASSSPIHGTIPLHGKGLKMGQYAEVHRKFTQEDVNLFGRLSGDMNPVHFPMIPPKSSSSSATIYHEDGDESTTSSIHRNNNNNLPIVHGILLSSLFSNIFGTLIPGAIYRHQSLKFHNVVHVNECVVGRVVVTKLRQINRKGRGGGEGGNGTGGGGVLCTCDTSVIKMGVVTAEFNDDETREDTTHNINNKRNQNDGNNEKKEIVCISGEAQVWLPDLQLVYECREKGE